MTPEQAEQFRYNILDLTKIWPHSQFPLRKVGKVTLNKNPDNYFAEIEQVRLIIPSVIPQHVPPIFLSSTNHNRPISQY